MAERATERVAVLMPPTETDAYAHEAVRFGLSLGQFFLEAGAAYTRRGDGPQADEEVLEAALTQLELSTLRAERVLDEAPDEVRTALQAQG